MIHYYKLSSILLLVSLIISGSLIAQTKKYNSRQIKALKTEASEKVENKAKMAQVMVDKVFSFAELGFQEFETSKYLTSIDLLCLSDLLKLKFSARLRCDQSWSKFDSLAKKIKTGSKMHRLKLGWASWREITEPT